MDSNPRRKIRLFNVIFKQWKILFFPPKSTADVKTITNLETQENLENWIKFLSFPPFCSIFWWWLERLKGSLEPVVSFCKKFEQVWIGACFCTGPPEPGDVLFELKKMSQTDGCPCAFRLTDPDEKRGLLFHEFWQQSLTTKDVTHISQPSNFCMNECFVLVFWHNEESQQVQKLGH